MKLFMIKSISLITVLIFAIIFGMVIAKNNMVHMQGIHQQQPKALLNLDINFPKPNENQPVVKGQSIDDKVAKLEKIKTFNPYAKMGNGFSNFVQSTLRKGINYTTEEIIQVVHTVIKS